MVLGWEGGGVGDGVDVVVVVVVVVVAVEDNVAVEDLDFWVCGGYSILSMRDVLPIGRSLYPRKTKPSFSATVASNKQAQPHAALISPHSTF